MFTNVRLRIRSLTVLSGTSAQMQLESKYSRKLSVEIPEVIHTGFKAPYKVLTVEWVERSKKEKKLITWLQVQEYEVQSIS